MATCITFAGESLIAQKQANGEALAIDKFILAYVPGIDPNDVIDRAEGKPDAAQTVHEYLIPDDHKGYVNPNQVVYSMLLASDLGNFTFNWLGLYSSVDDTVVAISHLPELDKIKTDPAKNITGNNLTRNVLLEFSGAQTATNITVEAKTWQVDFTARLNGVDERMRKACRDIYGRNCFIKDAALVNNDVGKFTLQGGFGYVEGIRVDFSSMPVIPGVLPKKIWLDVALQQQGSDKVAVSKVVSAAPAESKADYTDGTNDAHYLVPIAEISSGGVVTDLRRVEQVETDVIKYLMENGGKKEVTAHIKDRSAHGFPLDGGEEGQVLIKQSDGSLAWGDVSGTPVGQLCWSSTPKALPGTVAVNVKQKFALDMYPQLVEFARTSGGYLTDEAAWDAQAAAQEGACGHYCITNTHIILPCIKHYIGAARPGVAGKKVGDWASDAIKAHKHIQGQPYEAAAGGQYGKKSGPARARTDVESATAKDYLYTSTVGGPETMPKTSYLLPCIKVFDVAVNAAQVDMLALAQQVAELSGNDASGTPVGQLCWSSTPKALPGTVAVNIKQKFALDVYPQLVEFARTSGGYLTDEAAWDAQAAAQEGTCGKYCITDTHIILPCFKHYIGAARPGVAGKKVGDWAGDAIKSHYHLTGVQTGNSVKAEFRQGGQRRLTGWNISISTDSSRAGSTNNVGGPETMPKTSYLLPCIKVFDVAVNAAQVDMLALANKVAELNEDKVNRSDWVELVAGRAWKRPDGIIEQIGTATLANSSPFSVTFPVAFTASPHLSVTAVKANSNSPQETYPIASSLSKTGFVLRGYDDGANSFASVSGIINWIARGK